MKSFLVFILISASKSICGCGFYPYGEDTRISLFNPSIFGYYAYSDFYYSSHSFSSSHSDSTTFPTNYVEPNTRLWFNYCRGKVDMKTVSFAVYKLMSSEINAKSQNEMIQYLYRQKDSDALNYLVFAKNCEFSNSWQEDPWERQTFLVTPKRLELMNQALTLAEMVQNKELKKRYAFLAIRLAWYNREYEKIKSIFTSAFEKTNNKDILYYWSLYFKSFTEKDISLANFELAQVFANATDKRFVCHQYFNKGTSLEKILQFAKTNEEKANVYLLAGVEKYDKALPYLQKIYEFSPASEGLSFLVLREINKIEDFVFTPYYTLFGPSLSYNFWSEGNADVSVQQILNRSEGDRIYAKEVLKFISSIDIKKVKNPVLWESAKAYLQFITRDYKSCLVSVKHLQKSTLTNELANQLQIIKSLALTANQIQGAAIIPSEIQSSLIENKKNAQFLFAIGKELEYLGNSTDAALLYSKFPQIWYEENSNYGNKSVFWKTAKNKEQTYTDYFTDYIEYTDVVYTPEQTQRLIDNIEENKDKTDLFSLFKYEKVKSHIPRLYDLLGTKYIRQNKLDNALLSFEKAGTQYWNRAYTSWDDNANIFDQNPFYTLKYTPTFIAATEKIRLNKYTVTKKLINYLHKAEDKKEKDRDYYYFLVANAYYNMGAEGNVSMMRRFSSWSKYSLSPIEDEVEFRQSNLAKQYYLLAKQYAQTDKYKALCLRMIVRCEKHKIEYNSMDWNLNNYDYDSLFTSNKYYIDLKTNYVDYFDDLVSNCDRFDRYFGARR